MDKAINSAVSYPSAWLVCLAWFVGMGTYLLWSPIKELTGIQVYYIGLNLSFVLLFHSAVLWYRKTAPKLSFWIRLMNDVVISRMIYETGLFGDPTKFQWKYLIFLGLTITITVTRHLGWWSFLKKRN